MTFAAPIFLYAAIVVLPAALLLLLWAERQRRRALARLGNPTLVARLGSALNRRGRRWQQSLGIASLALLLLALARPQWGEVVQTIELEGVQVMVALDVSTSMLAEDIKPSRLERAKLEIADLMNKLNGDEIGLVLFSGVAFIQFPLTSDYGTARTFLDSARPGVISRPGTNISDAILTAMSGYDQNSSSQRILVLITDGEAHDGDAINAAQQAADQGVAIYTIGFGSPDGTPVPEIDAYGNVLGFKRDENGQPVLSRLDEPALQQIARIGNGQYYRAAASGVELDALVAELNKLQTGEIGEQVDVRRIERFQLFAALALAALVLATVIPDRHRRLQNGAQIGAQNGAQSSATRG